MNENEEDDNDDVESFVCKKANMEGKRYQLTVFSRQKSIFGGCPLPQPGTLC